MIFSLVPSQNFKQGICAVFIIGPSIRQISKLLMISFSLLLPFYNSAFVVGAQASQNLNPCPDNTTNGLIKVNATLKPGWIFTVRSPRFPDNYPKNASCSWIFTAPGNYEFLVAFKHFQLEPSKECRSDYLHVSFTDHSIPDWKRYCSIQSDNYIKTLYLERWHTHVFSEKMMLMFISDGSSEFKGFEGEVRLVAPALVPPNQKEEYCVSHLNDTSGSFTSPKYDNPYPTNMSCTWHIAVPRGKKVHLRFTFFDLENKKNEDGDCANDFVEIREGVWGRKGGIILGRFCNDGTERLPPEVFSPSNQMWVRFTSNDDLYNEYKGFHAEFKDSSWPSGSSGFLPSFTCVTFAVLFVLTAWFYSP